MKIVALLPADCHKDWTLPIIPTISLPDSAILKNGNPVFIPDFDNSFSAIPYLAVKINRLGKNVASRFSERYYSEAAPVLILRADNIFESLKKAGLPWNSAIAFDKSIVTGEFSDYNKLKDASPLSIAVNDEKIADFIIPEKEVINNAVSQVSRYNSLKMGDLILIPIDSEPIHLNIDTLITISENENILLKLPVK